MNPEIKEALIRKLGKEKVNDNPETLQQFAGDITENPAGQPDLVVFAEFAEDVRNVLVEANRLKVPVVPVMANTNLGALAVPAKGGIVLNLSGMNRILEVNEEDQYAVIEPGVTWEEMSEYLEKNHPGLRFAYPLSPPDTGVVPNFILDGLCNLSLRHGSASHWINGLEAVLPDGELLKTGHFVYGGIPCTRSPFPNLEGIFTSFQGTTGVVVKMSVQLWPSKKHRQRIFLMAYDVDHAFGFIKDLIREDIADDLGTLSLPAGKMLFGEYRPLYQDPAEPLLFAYMDFSSNFEFDFKSKRRVIDEILQGYRDRGAFFDGPLDIEELVRLDPRFAKFAKFPTRLDFLLDHEGGGLTWIGTYGPMSRFEEGFKKGSEIMLRHGLPPVIVARPMQGGHFGVLRWITVFDLKDEQDCQKAAAVNRDLADLAVNLGFFPYKTPQWVWERYQDRLDPTFRRVVRDLKKTMDPQGIMNPGHLEL
ncbi:FAD-binding oxidoreductase [Myxococcota bacterium]